MNPLSAPAVRGAIVKENWRCVRWRYAQVDDTRAVRNVTLDITYGVRNVISDITYGRLNIYSGSIFTIMKVHEPGLLLHQLRDSLPARLRMLPGAAAASNAILAAPELLQVSLSAFPPGQAPSKSLKQLFRLWVRPTKA